MRKVFAGKHYDIVIDKIAYCSDEIRSAMEAISCDRYIFMSTTAVYEPKHLDTKENEFDAAKKTLCWCGRADFPYDEIKRQAECALSKLSEWIYELIDSYLESLKKE